MSTHRFEYQVGSTVEEEGTDDTHAPSAFELRPSTLKMTHTLRKELWGGGEPNTEATFALRQAPRKKRFRPDIFTSSMAELCTADMEYAGDNGYCYSISYSSGYVTLAVYTSFVVDLSSNAKTACTMTVKDWSLFREVVCTDLDDPGFPELVYVSQWDTCNGSSIYRVEADRFTRTAEDFIFLRVCSEREKLVAARGREEWKLKPYPVSIEEYEKWFKNGFFIQWCDWEILKTQFDTIDYVIRRDKIRNSYENIRKRLLFEDDDQQPHPLPRTLYRPKIVRHKD